MILLLTLVPPRQVRKRVYDSIQKKITLVVSTLGAGYNVPEPSNPSTPNSTSGTKQSLASGETVLDGTKISTLEAVPEGNKI